MKIDTDHFNLEIKTVVLALVIISLLTSLGFWQVSRRSEKLEIERQINEKNHAEIINLNELTRFDIAELKYRKVKVRGHFERKGITYIDNVVHDGVYGFYVYVPFKLENNDQYVLVNRGWVPKKNRREPLPEINVSKEIQQIAGSLRMPSKRPFVPSSVEKLNVDEKNLWLYIDLEKYSEEAPFKIFPFVIYQAPEEGTDFIREWPVFNPKTVMHTGYAIMWFSLALIALITFIYMSFSKSKEKQNE